MRGAVLPGGRCTVNFHAYVMAALCGFLGAVAAIVLAVWFLIRDT